MGPLVALLLMLSLSSLWVFFRFQPYVDPSKERVLTVVNRLFLGLAVVLGALAAARAYAVYAPSATSPGLLPSFAASYALGFFFVCMLAGLVMRNFVIFRGRSRF